MTAVPEQRRGKAYGYVTVGDRLLVFREPDFPDVWLQVPGGTLEENETPEEGIVRELNEEMGRDDFIVRGLIGRHTFRFEEAGVVHVHDRHFFHVTPSAEWPATWRNVELTPHSGVPPVLFEFFWVPLGDQMLRLSGELEQALPALRRKMGLSA